MFTLKINYYAHTLSIKDYNVKNMFTSMFTSQS